MIIVKVTKQIKRFGTSGSYKGTNGVQIFRDYPFMPNILPLVPFLLKTHFWYHIMTVKKDERKDYMNLKTIIKIIPLVGVLVMLLWGFLGNAWNISWLAVVIGGILTAILHVIAKDIENNKNNNNDKE